MHGRAANLRGSSFEARLLRETFGLLPSGVVACCALIDGKPTGMVASTFVPVSLSPPLVSVCIQNGSTTWQKLRHASAIGFSFLGEGQDDLARQLAAKYADRFLGASWTVQRTSAVLLHGATVWLICRVVSEYPAGDHTIAVLEIVSLKINEAGAPLVFFSSKFRQLAAASA